MIYMIHDEFHIYLNYFIIIINKKKNRTRKYK